MIFNLCQFFYLLVSVSFLLPFGETSKRKPRQLQFNPYPSSHRLVFKVKYASILAPIYINQKLFFVYL